MLIQINMQNRDEVVEALDEEEEDEAEDVANRDLTNPLWSATLVINSDISAGNVQTKERRPTM